MKYRTTSILLALTVSAFTFVAVVSRSAKPPAATSPAEVPSAGAEFQKRVSALESELNTLRALVIRAPAPAPSASSTTPAPADTDRDAAPATALPTATPEEHDRQLVDATLTSFDAAFVSEARDPNWERQSAKVLAPVFAKPEFASSRVSAVDCVQSLCKIVIQHQDARARADFVELTHRVVAPFNAPAFIHYSPSTNETSFFVAREGQALPLAPPAG